MEKQEAIQILLKQGVLPTPNKIQALTETVTAIAPQQAKVKAGPSNEGVEILRSYQYEPRKFGVADFAEFFRARYNTTKAFLFSRPEVAEAVSINRAINSPAKKVTLIAMVGNISKLPSGTLKVGIEDPTGAMNAIISAKKDEMAEAVKFISNDDVVAISGGVKKDTLFADNIIWPDIPAKPVFYAPEDVYVAFTGDLHAGSKKFLPEQLQKFIEWLNGRLGSDEQKEIAKKTKYVVVLGDIVDGVGVYPHQEKELNVLDIYKQYDLAAEFFKQIPADKQIIICPGNHDALRMAEPQPPLYKDFAASLWALKNVTMVSNPATIRLHAMDKYPGLEILMYHGYSFAYYVDKIEGLREAGGFDAPDKLIEYLLKRRHLAPAYGSTLALPLRDDPLAIYQVPDVIATAHIHKAKLAKYKNTITISSSCWQEKTPFLERVGLHPEPARVPVLNLKDRSGRMMRFV